MENNANAFHWLQVASAAARAVGSYAIESSCSSSIPRLPFFIRAAALSAAVCRRGPHALVGIRTLEELTGCFISDKYKDTPAVASMLMEFLELRHMLIFIDGLDEAADNRCLFEESIDRASRDNAIGLMVSTREYAFESSRACHRLSGFDPVKIQALDDTQKGLLIQRRLPSASVHRFCTHLEHAVVHRPEMASSPLLLCLLIEVFKREGSIPNRRHEIYERLVQGLLVSHMDKDREKDSGIRKSRRMQHNSSSDAAEFLQALAFVCHMRLKQRDFQWDSSAIKTQMQAIEIQETWQKTTSDSSLESMGSRLLKPSTVGLLSKVGDLHFRFSHLTLQEYLAAKCMFRLFGHDAQQLLHQLLPLHSRWTREVAQFVACMLSAETFTRFCELVLASEDRDGAGAQCEIVHDFLKERGSSEKVEQMVRNKMREIRGADSLVTGLCHPSHELRDRVLSEMKLFRVPPDPFAYTDGTVAQLKHVAEDREREWYKRSAAILSVVQIAQMDHCQKGTGREDTLRWVLDMLLAGAEEDTYFARVTSLGTCFKGLGNHEAGVDCIMLASQHEQQIFACLNLTLHEKQLSINGLSEALADLRAYSEGLVDWVLDKSLIEKGEWPLRHVLLFCERAAACADSGRAAYLFRHLLGRVHAMSTEAFQIEQEHVLKGLSMILALQNPYRPPEVLHFLEHGEPQQRVRVLCVAADLNVQFVGPTLVDFARALLSQQFQGLSNQSVLAHFLELEFARRESELVSDHMSLGKVSRAFHYLEAVMKPAAQDGGAPQQVVAELNNYEIMFEKRKQKRERDSRCVIKVEEEGKQKQAKESKQELEHVSLEALADAVEMFTPTTLNTFDREADVNNLINIYCAAIMWGKSGLIQHEDIFKRLSLSDLQSVAAHKVIADLLALKEPWINEFRKDDGSWEEAVCNVMQDLRLGRLFFSIMLQYIQDSFQSHSDTAMKKLQQLKDKIEQWQPHNAEEHLERSFLLKELRIGCRSQHFPTWTGLVSSTDCHRGDCEVYTLPSPAHTLEYSLGDCEEEKEKEEGAFPTTLRRDSPAPGGHSEIRQRPVVTTSVGEIRQRPVVTTSTPCK